jgi:hypothetical protein
MKVDIRILLSLSVLVTLGCASAESTHVPEPAPEAVDSSDASEGGVINGIVKDSNTSQGIENAVVMLDCDCLTSYQERYTNQRGIYSFTDLPAGNYTVQVMVGNASVSKATALAEGSKLRADFAIDPG